MPEAEEFPTTIGPDATFKGELKFEKGARLLGKVDGQIETKGRLIIAESGKLAGEAQAGDIRVEGQVKGNLQAAGKLQLSASSRIEGDIQASRLEVAEGAVLQGRCSIGGNGATKPVSAPAGQVKTQPEATPGSTPAKK